MKYIITSTHESDPVRPPKMTNIRYSKPDCDRTVSLLTQCGYINIQVQEVKEAN